MAGNGIGTGLTGIGGGTTGKGAGLTGIGMGTGGAGVVGQPIWWCTQQYTFLFCFQESREPTAQLGGGGFVGGAGAAVGGAGVGGGVVGQPTP